MAVEQLAQSNGTAQIICEQNSHIVGLENQIDGVGQTTWMILTKLKGGLAAIFEVKSMVGVIFQWVVDQRSREEYSMGLRGLDPTLNQPLILEDALGNIVEISLSLADCWEVSAHAPMLCL